jgi:hypothetical protein
VTGNQRACRDKDEHGEGGEDCEAMVREIVWSAESRK